MIALGGFSSFVAKYAKAASERLEPTVLAHNKIIDHVLKLYEETKRARLNVIYSRNYLPVIQKELEELHRCLAVTPKDVEKEIDPNEKKKLTAYRHCIVYLPDSLLRKIRQHIEQLDYNALPIEEREYVNLALKYIGKLERLIRDYMERVD